MRVFLFLLVVTVAGCRFEARPDAPAQPDLDGAVSVEAADAQIDPSRVPSPAPDARQSAADGKPEVVLYVTEWCPYCSQAREYMAAQEIPHRVVDIEASAEGQAEYRAMGGTGGIPLVAVGAETIEGWSAGAAREMLDAAGYD